MKIVLDTTEIIRDPLLRGVQLQVLVEFARASSAELFVPGVVVQEAMRHMYEKARATATDMRKAIRGAALWLGSDVPLRETEKLLDETYRESHVEQLRPRLQQLGLRILDHPSVSHDRLVNALRLRRKPFGDDGAGYQDALVWCTVSSLAKEHPDVALITQNQNDFPADAEGHPESALQAWLDEDGVPVGRVRIYHSAESFSAKVILPAYPLVAEKVQILAGKHPTIDLRGAIVHRAAKIVLTALANTPSEYLTPSISEDAMLNLEDLQVDVTEVTSLSDDDIRVTVSSAFTINVEAVRKGPVGISFLDGLMRAFDRLLGDTLLVSADLTFVFDRHDGGVSTFHVEGATVGREGRGQILGSKVTWQLVRSEPAEQVAVDVRPLERSSQQGSVPAEVGDHAETPALPSGPATERNSVAEQPSASE